MKMETKTRGQQQAVERLMLSKRILVVGSSGAGKSYLSIRLAQLLEMELIHLDNCFWQPGWRPTAVHEWREIVSALLQRNSWIMDGTYENSLDLRIPASDALIVLERSPIVCLWNVLMRTIRSHKKPRPDAPMGQKLDPPFIKYIWRYPTITRPMVYGQIEKYGSDKELIILRGRDAIHQLLGDLQTLCEQKSHDQKRHRQKDEGYITL